MVRVSDRHAAWVGHIFRQAFKTNACLKNTVVKPKFHAGYEVGFHNDTCGLCHKNACLGRRKMRSLPLSAGPSKLLMATALFASATVATAARSAFGRLRFKYKLAQQVHRACADNQADNNILFHHIILELI